MNNADVRQFLIDECVMASYPLPERFHTWQEYVEHYVLDVVLDDLDRFLPSWERLTPEVFEEKVLSLRVPDTLGNLSPLREQWRDLLIPF
jgi:hypothetical protein